MNAEEIRKIVERDPFRPFKVRLTNGNEYYFKYRRDLGMPRRLRHTLYYFRDYESVLIDVVHIAEILDGEQDQQNRDE